MNAILMTVMMMIMMIGIQMHHKSRRSGMHTSQILAEEVECTQVKYWNVCSIKTNINYRHLKRQLQSVFKKQHLSLSVEQTNICWYTLFFMMAVYFRDLSLARALVHQDEMGL